jgi:ABC-type glycerol-3-phosphate transport system permease component
MSTRILLPVSGPLTICPGIFLFFFGWPDDLDFALLVPGMARMSESQATRTITISKPPLAVNVV